MLGYGPGEMRADPAHWPELVHPDDLPLAMASIEAHLAGRTELHEVEFRARTRQGEWRWFLTRGRVVERDKDGTPLMMSGTHSDVTVRKQLELEQRDAGVVFASSYEGILVANAEGLITKVNPSFTRITGYEPAEVAGQSPRMLSSGRHDARFFAQFWTSLNEQGFWHGEMWNRRKNGELFAALQSVTAVRDASGRVIHYVSVFADISQIKAHEAELDRVANYDSLTGLPNRRLLSDRLNQSIIRSDRSGKLTAVCFLDLDGFKSVNDRLGHEAGDLVLIGVARHLKTVLRSDDTLARLGGDEFVLLLSDVSSAEECAQVLARVQEAVRQPVEAAGQYITISASIGVSLYPADNADPDTLMRHADQAMYLAKQAGKNRYQLFDPGIDRIAQAHREFLSEMEAALGLGEFVLFYQPKVDLASGEVIGVEALIRWQHPQRGLLAPSEFLPHLNGSPMEWHFGEWVIDTALTRIQMWKANGLSLKVSVNISANHLLRSDFTERLGQALSRHPGIHPSDLELEVLETAAIQDMEQAVEILQKCMALGVRFSLDDFGTGYSSLTYLRKLPVDTLKIDQSFVRDMLTDPVDLGIVKGVIQLAAVFNRQVIAEGVETLEHGAALRKLGCRLAQGYGISRPMPAELMNSWCAEWQRDQKWKDL
jgi:diguanylate cyclase (GGDEF)-like protein/PAS domain S-box-containing protein